MAQLLRYKYSVISEVCKAGIFTRSHDYFSPQTIKQNHNQVANSNNILVSLDHFYQTSCMQLSFTHSDAKFIHLISYKKGSKRTVWILVKLGAFVSIGSILLDIKCPLYEWISLSYKVPAFDTSVPMKLACYTVYHKLTVLLVYLYPIFPPIFHCAFLQNGLLFLL